MGKNFSVVLILCFAVGAVAWLAKSRPAPEAIASLASDIPEGLRADGPPATSVAAFAQALPTVPGELICSDSQTVGAVAELYEESWRQKLQAKMTRGQSTLINGSPLTAPNPGDFGCILVQPGTQVMLDTTNIVPVVSVKLQGGWAKGVTFPNMFTIVRTQPSVAEANAMEARNAAAVAAAEAATLEGYQNPTSWSPVSSTAEAITGPIMFSTQSITLADQPFPISFARFVKSDEAETVYALFSKNVPQQMDGFLFKASIAGNDALLQGNTLCGQDDATWILALVSRDNQGSLDMAYFSGTSMPDLSTTSLKKACATFSYQSTK